MAKLDVLQKLTISHVGVSMTVLSVITINVITDLVVGDLMITGRFALETLRHHTRE